MEFFSWVFLTAATAVAILVGRWLTLGPDKKMNFDGAVVIGSVTGGALALLGGLLSPAAQLGMQFGAFGVVFFAILGSIIGFVVTAFMAWLIFQPWSWRARNWLNDKFSGISSANSQSYIANGQYPPRPQNPPNYPTDSHE